MSGLADARSRLPALANLDDAQFIDAVHKMYYPGMDKAQLEAKLGYVAPPPPAEKAGIVRTAGDVAIKLGQGVVDLGSAAVGAASLATGGKAGEFMRGTLGYDPEGTNALLGEYLSDSQKAADAKVAAAEGFGDTIAASLENPRAILGTVVQSVPGMVGGMAATSALAGRIGVKAALATAEGAAASTAVRAAGGTAREAAKAALSTQAGGVAAKSAIEAAGTRLIATGAAVEGAQSGGMIADRAQAAGREYSDYALPAIAAGAGTGLIGVASGKLFGDAATEIATGAGTGVRGGLAKRVGKGMAVEGAVEEMPQSAQEQVFTNMAMGDELDKGVGNAAASGLLAGAAMGGGMAAFQGNNAADAPPAPAPVVLPNTGPLSQAANAGQAAAAAAAAAAAPAAPPQPAPGMNLDQIRARLAELDAIGRGTPAQRVQDPLGFTKTVPAVKGRKYTPEEQAEFTELMRAVNDRTSIPPDQVEAFRELQAQEAAEKTARMQEAQRPQIEAAEAARLAEQQRRDAAEEAEIRRMLAQDEAEQRAAAEQENRALMDETNARVERDHVARAQARRQGLLDDVLNDTTIPMSDKPQAFQEAMKREGYTFPVMSFEELDVINAFAAGKRGELLDFVLRSDDIPAAEKAQQFSSMLDWEGFGDAALTAAELETIAEATAPVPAAPNELVDAVPERAPPAPAPAGPNMAAVDEAIASGMRLKTANGNVLHKKGSSKIFKLSAAQKAHYLERMAAQVGPEPMTPSAQRWHAGVPTLTDVLAPADGIPVLNDQVEGLPDIPVLNDVLAPADGIPVLRDEVEGQPEIPTLTDVIEPAGNEAPPARNEREIAYDDALIRHNQAVDRYKAAQAAGDSAGMEAAREEVTVEKIKMRQASLGGIHEALALGQRERLISETARISNMPIGTQARPSEFAPELGIYYEKTNDDEWIGRGDWFNAGKVRGDEEMAERGGLIYTEPSAERQALDAAAHEAATSPRNDRPEPTDAQKEAGNYKKGHVKLHGLDISIENPAGSVRRGVDPAGTPWETTMQNHYGDILGTKGADGDAVDVFIGENLGSEKVFVVDQVDPGTGKFDEHKVMLGFDSLEAARAAYQANYDAGWTGGRNVTETTVEAFKKWLSTGKTKKPFAKIVPAEVATPASESTSAPTMSKFDLNKMTVKDMSDEQLLQARTVLAETARAPKIEKEIERRKLDEKAKAQAQLEARRADARAHWKVGMPTSLDTFSEIEGGPKQTYTQMVPGVIEAIDGDTATVRIYATPEYGYNYDNDQLHGKRAINVPLTELGRRPPAELQRIIDAGMLAQGDPALAAEVRARMAPHNARDAKDKAKAAAALQEDAPAAAPEPAADVATETRAPEHARMDGTGPKSKQFTSPEFLAAAEEVKATNEAWVELVTKYDQWFTPHKDKTSKKRKLRLDAPTEVHAALRAWSNRSKAASDAYNNALTAPQLGVAKGQPLTQTAPIDDSKILMEMDRDAFATVTDEWAALFAEPSKAERVSMDSRVQDELTPEQAEARIQEWREHALRQGETHAAENSQRTVLSLFDLTGEWSQPWRDAGYNVIQFDIQSGQDVFDFSVEYFTENYDLTDVYCILAATPCTDFASSGAKHFLKKDADGRTEQSVELVNKAAATIEYFRPAVWALENPVGRLSNLTGLPEPRLSFQPHHFGDPYTKRTMIWGQFNAELPTANVHPSEGSKMHSQYGGSSIETKNARSETPEGFAYAFFMANNYVDMPAERRLTTEYPEASGAVAEALKAGISAEEIHKLIEYDYGNDEFEQARNTLIDAVAARKAGAQATEEVAAAPAAAEPEQEPVDDGADIPLAFYKKVKVPLDVLIEDEGRYESVEMSADKALASVREDITHLEALLKCMGG